MGNLTASQARLMLIQVASTVVKAKELLCEADRNIGDGDHGIGMAKGFEEARKELEAREYEDVYQVFSTVGRTMIRVMGGASGIIFGLLFYAGSKNMPPQPSISEMEFAWIFQKALIEIKAKGQAKLGDKTVVDALEPMVETLLETASKGCTLRQMLAQAYLSADAGKECTKDYIARFGKAKTLGERAIGYPDAGAVSLTMISGSMRDWATENL
jgi:dihydroxyacetone kinase-like protein